MRRVIGLLFGLLAAGVELPAVGLLLVADGDSVLLLAPYAHLLAALNCKIASDLWNGGPVVDHDAVLLTAICVPVFGPCFAWLFPRRRGGEAVLDAHAAFEQFEELTTRGIAGAAVMPEAWEHTGDQTSPMSFAEILQHGSLDHKRNAVRMLAEFGGERHLRLLRDVLVRETGELRLCAFIELDRIARRYEERIAELRSRLEAAPDDPTVLTYLAEAHRDLSRSGLLDSDMALYHLRQAMTYVQEAFELQPDDEHTLRARATILCDAGEHEKAATCLDRVADNARDEHRNRVLRARIAYCMRDFDEVRREATAIAAQRVKAPEWMEVLANRPRAAAAAVAEEDHARLD